MQGHKNYLLRHEFTAPLLYTHTYLSTQYMKGDESSGGLLGGCVVLKDLLLLPLDLDLVVVVHLLFKGGIDGDRGFSPARPPLAFPPSLLPGLNTQFHREKFLNSVRCVLCVITHGTILFIMRIERDQPWLIPFSSRLQRLMHLRSQAESQPSIKCQPTPPDYLVPRYTVDR